MTKPSTHPGRVFLALVVAPLAGCILSVFVFAIIGGQRFSLADIPAWLHSAGWVWLYSLPLSVPLGGLVHLCLLKLRLWPVTAYTLVGLLLGPLALLIWLAFLGLPAGEIDASSAWLGAITGGFTALVFRILVHRTEEMPSFPPAGTRPY